MDQLSDEQKSQAKQTFNRFVRNIHSVDPEKIKREAKDYLESLLNEREDIPDDVREKLRIGQYLLTTYYPFDLDEPEDRVALAALQYLLDPWDGVSDVIPERGLVDDAFVLSFARKKIQTLKNKNQKDDAGQEEEAGEQSEMEEKKCKGHRNESVQDSPVERKELDEQEMDNSEPLDGEGDQEPETGDDTRRGYPEEDEVKTPADRVQKRRELIQNGYEVVEANEDLSEVVWYNEQKDERIVGTGQAWDHYQSKDDSSTRPDSGEAEGQETEQEEPSITGDNEGDSAGDTMFNRILSSITTQPSEDPNSQSTTGSTNQEEDDGPSTGRDLEDSDKGSSQESHGDAEETEENQEGDAEDQDPEAEQESGDENEIEVDDIVDVHGEKRGKVKSAYSHYLEVRLSRSHVELYKRSECELVRSGKGTDEKENTTKKGNFESNTESVNSSDGKGKIEQNIMCEPSEMPPVPDGSHLNTESDKELYEELKKSDTSRPALYRRLIRKSGYIKKDKFDQIIENMNNDYSPDCFSHNRCLLLLQRLEEIEWKAQGNQEFVWTGK